MKNVLYEIATGAEISSTTMTINPIPAGMGVKATDKAGIWNASVLDYAPIPASTVITMQEFTKRIGMAKMQAILVASKTDIAVETLLRYTDKFITVDTTDPELIYGLDYLVTAEVLTEVEKEAILNG